MERDLTLSIADHVHSFHDIYLAMVRPVRRIGEPQCRPSTTASWCVDYIEDEEAGAIMLLGFNADRETAS